MSVRGIATRAFVPAAAAVCALGLMSTAAWADPPHPPPPPPGPINQAQCDHGHGHLAPDPHDRRIRRCVGGPFNGREVR